MIAYMRSRGLEIYRNGTGDIYYVMGTTLYDRQMGIEITFSEAQDTKRAIVSATLYALLGHWSYRVNLLSERASNQTIIAWQFGSDPVMLADTMLMTINMVVLYGSEKALLALENLGLEVEKHDVAKDFRLMVNIVYKLGTIRSKFTLGKLHQPEHTV